MLITPGGEPFNSHVGHRKDQIVHSHLQLLHISLLTSEENLMLDQDNFYLLSYISSFSLFWMMN